MGDKVAKVREPSWDADETYDEAKGIRQACLVCDTTLTDSESFSHHKICPVCGFHYSMSARERIDSIADRGTFRETNRSLKSIDPLSFSSRIPYKQLLSNDQERTGMTEAVVTGSCTIGGSPATLIVLDFGFMGGSMGCVVGEKVALALENAVKRKNPVIAIVTTGGSRVQEGILSLMQMAKTSNAVNQLSDKGLPFISVLANPATGHVFASFGNLADFIFAEPGAIIGLAPIKVIKETSLDPLPAGSHTSESHLTHGMVDAVVERDKIRELLAGLIDLLGAKYRLRTRRKRDKPKIETVPEPDAWTSVQLARHGLRPTAMDYISRTVDSFVELRGDRCYGDDPAVITGIGHLGGQTVMIVAQERGHSEDNTKRNHGRTSPEGFRKASRIIGLAKKFDLPLITFIDTPGPFYSLETEERGLGNALANTMASIGALHSPSISIIIGEGGSEGALALGVTNRVIMMENAIYSSMPPEDAANLLYQDESKAHIAAESLKLTARDCLALDIIDNIVQEPPGGAHTNPDQAARQLRRILLQELADLQSMSRYRIRRERYKKFRNMGEYSSHFRTAIRNEIRSLQGVMSTGVRKVTRKARGSREARRTPSS